MPFTWADHLGIARAVASIGDYSVGEAASLIAVGLHLMQRDLLFADEIALTLALIQSKNNSLSVVNE